MGEDGEKPYSERLNELLDSLDEMEVSRALEELQGMVEEDEWEFKKTVPQDERFAEWLDVHDDYVLVELGLRDA